MRIRVVVAGAGLLVFGACNPVPTDPALSEAPVAAVSAAVEPTPPVLALKAEEAISSVDLEVLCQIFERAMSDDAGAVIGSGCVVTPGASSLTIATKDASASLEVPLVVDGSVVQLTQAIASPKALAASRGGFSNVGLMFFGRADAAPLCMSVEYQAPDGAANSFFFGRGPDKKPSKFEAAVTGDSFAVVALPEPVVAPGKVRVFTLTRREPGTVLKSVSFKAC